MSLPIRSSFFPPSDRTKSFESALAVVEEVVLDHIAAVAEAQDEVLVPEVRVVLHHVPEDRPIADGHHRLGTFSPASRMRMPRPPQKSTTFILNAPALTDHSAGFRHRRPPYQADASVAVQSLEDPWAGPAEAAAMLMACLAIRLPGAYPDENCPQSAEIPVKSYMKGPLAVDQNAGGWRRQEDFPYLILRLADFCLHKLISSLGVGPRPSRSRGSRPRLGDWRSASRALRSIRDTWGAIC